MMTTLDASNQQIAILKEKVEKARSTVSTNEEKLSDLQTKQDKLMIVAANYSVEANRLKDYVTITKMDNLQPDRVQIEAENKLAKMQEKKAQVEYKRDKVRDKYEELMARKKQL